MQSQPIDAGVWLCRRADFRLYSQHPIVAILLPMVQGWCQRRGISPTRVLMRLSFATLIGGTIALIGTSTSLLASDLVTRLCYGSFELVSFTAIGMPCGCEGPAISWLLAVSCLIAAIKATTTSRS